MNEYLIKITVNGDTTIQKMYADSMKNENISLDFYWKDVKIAEYLKEHVTWVTLLNSTTRKTGFIYPE